MPADIQGLAITREDADEIAHAFKGNMKVIQNGIEHVKELTDQYIEASFNSTHLLFLGGLDFEPNIHAVHTLTRHIWPKLVNKNLPLVLDIVGRSPVESVRSAIDNCSNVK